MRAWAIFRDSWFVPYSLLPAIAGPVPPPGPRPATIGSDHATGRADAAPVADVVSAIAADARHPPVLDPASGRASSPCLSQLGEVMELDMEDTQEREIQR